MNSFISLFVLSITIICLSGCQTLKRTVLGTGDFFYDTGKEVVDTTYNSYKTMERADDWMQENLW
ncbi:MAG: hypothetical protein KAI91_06075 [Candidatus Omnitrophica bacterium]|nr:hypothetical protein [Candidatus Omnitrophota bacterium]